MNKRLEILFGGTVQGVGFRYATERIAAHFNVTGYVRNLPSGKVEVIAEGTETELKDFLTAVRESEMARYIRDVRPEWSPPTGEFKFFGIRY
ncbi:MAG TPA: acylphosphatase [Candidatus Omnitrophota bacterium]|nr:acylphosphatase [Candidatus Omnitrophota bacterium]